MSCMPNPGRPMKHITFHQKTGVPRLLVCLEPWKSVLSPWKDNIWLQNPILVSNIFAGGSLSVIIAQHHQGMNPNWACGYMCYNHGTCHVSHGTVSYLSWSDEWAIIQLNSQLISFMPRIHYKQEDEFRDEDMAESYWPPRSLPPVFIGSWIIIPSTLVTEEIKGPGRQRINWSSPVSNLVIARQSHLQSKYDNMCVNEPKLPTSWLPLIAGFEEHNKMFLAWLI